MDYGNILSSISWFIQDVLHIPPTVFIAVTVFLISFGAIAFVGLVLGKLVIAPIVNVIVIISYAVFSFYISVQVVQYFVPDSGVRAQIMNTFKQYLLPYFLDG